MNAIDAKDRARLSEGVNIGIVWAETCSAVSLRTTRGRDAIAGDACHFLNVFCVAARPVYLPVNLHRSKQRYGFPVRIVREKTLLLHYLPLSILNNTLKRP